MSFTLTVRAGPARLAPRLPQLAKNFAKPSNNTSVSAAVRAFHQSTTKNTFFTPKTATLIVRVNAKPSANLLSRLQGAARGYQQQSYGYAPPKADRGQLIRKLLAGGAIFGGTLIAINVVFNRETREDGGMPPFERSYLHSTFIHTGLGVGIIGLTAYQMIQSGFVYRLMVTNPWVFAIGGLALSFGTMLGTRAIDPDNYVPKYALWTAFNATQAAFVAPLMAMAPPVLLARAGLYTVAMMGGISFVGATAKQEKYLYIGGPLLAGAAIVAVSGFAPLILPVTAVRTLAITENLWLYGGLALFGGFTLYDVQKVLHHARLAERGIIKKDPINESISLELDFLNIFVRFVQILMMQQQRRK
ncbi:inhibitor of apoptosis-promoting Bax1-domain-containing protein [Apodospora peruviana]|uniref:Inhibitor of apoptosis-promoting Bax1-domain-containing protein n=1 Tax=Apodospora peruviana TaxID=516989 RepID=A0AAE0IQP3_9PEZI|nr:inhibitor of apoptosis-promoting Bax1-domain-containing protein [Apodospora peruviana]